MGDFIWDYNDEGEGLQKGGLCIAGQVGSANLTIRLNGYLCRWNPPLWGRTHSSRTQSLCICVQKRGLFSKSLTESRSGYGKQGTLIGEYAWEPVEVWERNQKGVGEGVSQPDQTGRGGSYSQQTSHQGSIGHSLLSQDAGRLQSISLLVPWGLKISQALSRTG